MKYITLFLLLLFPGVLPAEILIIHEKLVGDQWAADVTVIDDSASVADAVALIDSDPLKRRGDNMRAFGGIRMQILEEVVTGSYSWKESPTDEYVVFWAQLNDDGSTSSNPTDYHTATFSSLQSAEQFIQDVQDDPLRTLWDNRPYHATKRYTEHQEPSVIVYTVIAK